MAQGGGAIQRIAPSLQAQRAGLRGLSRTLPPGARRTPRALVAAAGHGWQAGAPHSYLRRPGRRAEQRPGIGGVAGGAARTPGRAEFAALLRRQTAVLTISGQGRRRARTLSCPPFLLTTPQQPTRQ